MTDVDDAVRAACEALPIFPLPRTVLMPGALLPLHVFEPRYRALVAHARERGDLFAIATLRPGYEADYDGRPAVWPEVGVGRIVAYQPLDDGRSNLVLAFVARGRIVREHAARNPFREVEVALAPAVAPTDPAIFERVRALVRQIGLYSVEAQAEAGRLLQIDAEALLDALARKLLEDVNDQRRYLAADRAHARAWMVEGALAELLASASPGVVGEA